MMKKYPEDVVMYILLKLPVKFLLRFKCVSRTCYTLIQSSIFIKLHLNRTTLKDNYILLKPFFKEDIEKYKAIISFLSINGDDYLNYIRPDLDAPYMTSPSSIIYDELIGPCHGLIALMHMSVGLTIFLNPSTRNFRLLPPSPFNVPQGYYRSIESGGFGFDSVVNDFKFFTISEVITEDRFGNPEKGEKKIEVYELGIDIWRELEYVDQELPELCQSTSSMFYNGAYYWIFSTLEGQVVIYCFDMSTEIFRYMQAHHTHLFSNGTLLHTFLLFNESLSFICYPWIGPMIDPTKDFIDIWIMKEYNVYESWIKKYTIRILPIESPLALWNDFLLLYQGKSGYLMSYDLNSDEIKELNLHGCLQSMRAIIYKESLTPIPRGSQSNM